MARLKKILPAIFKFSLLFLILIAVLEISSRLILESKERAALSSIPETLNVYEKMDDHDPSHWVLKPDFRATFADLIREKERTNKWFGLKLLRRWMETYYFTPGQTAISINSRGLRGPEIEKAQEGSTRIICLGDSLTFGLPGPFSYPRVIEGELKKRGWDAEVINAGVEGYSIENLGKQIDCLAGFNPDIVTLFIGWNDIYSDRNGLSSPWINYLCRRSNFLTLIRRTFRKIYRLLKFKSDLPPHILPDSLTGKCYEKTEVSYKPRFLDELIDLLDELRAKIPPAKIFLITLPSLFDLKTAPDNDSLKIGHLPKYTNNAYILASMVYKYNEDLRRLSGDRNYYLIDLEKYADSEFIPKKDYFFDACHLIPPAQISIGEYIAGVLADSGVLKCKTSKPERLKDVTMSLTE